MVNDQIVTALISVAGGVIVAVITVRYSNRPKRDKMAIIVDSLVSVPKAYEQLIRELRDEVKGRDIIIASKDQIIAEQQTIIEKQRDIINNISNIS